MPKVNMSQLQYTARNKRLVRKGLTYAQFLVSPKWQELRAFLKTKPEFQTCAVCGTDEHLDLHHMSYRRINRPSLKQAAQDIVALCRTHHREVHELARTGNYGLRRAVKLVGRAFKAGMDVGVR